MQSCVTELSSKCVFTLEIDKSVAQTTQPTEKCTICLKLAVILVIFESNTYSIIVKRKNPKPIGDAKGDNAEQ